MVNEVKKPDAADALEILRADHRSVEKLFDAFRPAPDAAADARFALVKRACEQLTVHAMLEEELLYPAASEALPDATIKVDEALVEHYLVKSLIQRFVTLEPSHTGFDATFKVLSELVRHHVDEEEKTLFPALRKSSLDLAELGNRIAARKRQLEEKLDAAGVRSTGDRTFSLSHLDFPE
ncbi:hemerythrin domain-containing protein [Paraburkholderia sp. CNPSo 3272]|uniref:hemerythrin domain-containing protein n=1 Tax=Paraburkholderia sp. CNPSo 3272 TaxID=2940931 RepID=UPI0020B88F9F|nr:hemerythrin domain-containing protein [Paraburkholderia sp. CNPSo 3272]MCP3726265.1 hemerythrin domain-containing protein [Paraburkholderia sp. CNPSo 3272]